MSDRNLASQDAGPTGGGDPLRDVRDVIDRGQRLADAPWPWDGYPYEWHVEAWLIGDFSALAAVALRQSDDG